MHVSATRIRMDQMQHSSIHSAWYTVFRQTIIYTHIDICVNLAHRTVLIPCRRMIMRHVVDPAAVPARCSSWIQMCPKIYPLLFSHPWHPHITKYCCQSVGIGSINTMYHTLGVGAFGRSILIIIINNSLSHAKLLVMELGACNKIRRRERNRKESYN